MNFCAPNNFIMLTNEMFRLAGIKEYKLFLEQLDNAKREGDIQRYIKKFSKWFIPGALMRDYDFGGMVSYLISEPALGNEYRADYMILGFNSVGPQVVLAEFEDVNVPYKISSANAETESVRKGLTQIRKAYKGSDPIEWVPVRTVSKSVRDADVDEE